MKRKLIIQPHTGFCSRILAINEAYQLAKQYNYQLNIIWKQTEDCNCDYWDAFDKKQFSDISCKVYQTFECKDLLGREIDNLKKANFREMFKDVFMIADWIYSIVTYRIYKGRKGLFFPYDRRDRKYHAEDYEDIKKCLQKGENCYAMPYEGMSGYSNPGMYDLSAICFAKAALDETEKILKGNENIIGVHIRRTDHVAAIAGSKTEDFIARMNKVLKDNPDTVFYLATDDFDEEKRIKEVFGSRIITQKNKDLSRASKAGMHTSLIDLLCLSRTKYILGSKRSVFSKVSAELNNIPLYIVEKE